MNWFKKEPVINTIFLVSSIGLIIIIILLGFKIKDAVAEETRLYQGVEMTQTEESEYSRKERLGERFNMIREGRAIPVKRMKACEWTPTGSLEPLQAEEDKNLDGYTDFIYVNVLNNERVAKDIKPKDTAYAGPDE